MILPPVPRFAVPATTLSLSPPPVRARRRQERRGQLESRAHCPTNGFWGNALTAKPTTSFRVGFQNINGFNLDSSDEKSQKLQHIITHHQFDFLGIQEVNLHLKIMGTEGVWKERHHQTFTGFTHAATTEHCTSPSRRIFGGTACFLTGPTAHRSISHGSDPSGLGRWSWSLLRGRNGLQTRILTGYRPVRSYHDEALTVYSQQELYFRQHGGWRDPRVAFFEDLDLIIQESSASGEQIILGMDLNEDSRCPEVQAWRTRWHLCEPLSLLHRIPDVATCRSNLTQTPIDAIWATPGLTVVKGGMTGFGELDLGSADHRCLWIDIDVQALYGMLPPPPAKRPNNSIPLNDPRVVRKYNNFVYKERQLQGIDTEILALESKAHQGTITHDDEVRFDALLTCDHAIRTEAKIKCRPFYSGKVLYSDTIGKDRKEIHLWNMVIARRLGKRSDTRAIRRLMHITTQPLALQMTLDEVQAAQSDCMERYKLHKKDHQNLHDKFRKSLCERRAQKYNTSVATQERIVIHNRKQSQAFQKIKRILGTKLRPSLTTVEHDPPGSDHSVTCYSKEDIEAACASEGQRRFTQAATTPFLTGSLLRDVGFRATQSTVDLILGGSYQPESDVDVYTRALITQMKMPEIVGKCPTLTGFVTTEEHIAGWKKMRPTIASSPFGPLFADHIAGCSDVRVADIDAAIAAIPVLTGYSPRAWKKAVDVMIPKKSSSVHVTKLRIIVLFHSLYNMINKHVGRITVRRAEELHLIPDEIYGSRPGYRANICALNKVLTYDVIRLHRFLAALCSNDAESCYDRILHAIASISLQRLGVAAETCRMMFGTLQDIEHYISTAYGLSDHGYGAIDIPLQGIGQGNGAGPSIWLLITIPLINMLRDAGFGFRSTTPISGTSYRFACYTFVDDTDTVHSIEDPSATYPEVVQEMQNAINTWEGGLRATGGALSAAKSYWYLLSMEWSQPKQRWQYQSIDVTPAQLTICGNPSLPRTPLTRYETSHAEETLGLWIAPDSNQKAQVTALQSKLAVWSDKIRTRQLPSSLAWLAVSSGISMALRYPLSATNLSKSECYQITKPLLDVALPAMGLPRRMPHALVFSPKEFLGFGIFDIWVQQGIDQISVCIDYASRWTNDITGHLLRDIAESLRIELGLPKPPLTYEYKKWQMCTTPTKLHTIWQFCSESGLQLRDGTPDSPLLRQNDRFIMEMFGAQPYTPKELAILNHCRLYLQVELLSDICSGDGLTLCHGMLECRKPLVTRKDRTWPRTGKPNPSRWRFWRDALIKCVLPLHARSLILTQPVGKWKGRPQGWQWLYSPQSNSLHNLRSDGLYNRHPVNSSGHRTRRPLFRRCPEGCPSPIPHDALPTTVHQTRNLLFHSGIESIGHRDTLEDGWCSYVVAYPTSMQDILEGIRDGTAIAVTDGSFKDGLGTAAFTIKPTLDSPVDAAYRLVNCTPGQSEDIDAYRSELGGIYGIINTINELCTSNQITQGSVTIACDCLSAISNLSKTYEPGPGQPHHDLLSHIRYLIRSSPVSWTFRHVRGHQDDHSPYLQLDPWEKLNVDMDGLAKSYWETLSNQPTPIVHVSPYPGQWSLHQGSYRFPSWTTKRATQFYYRAKSALFWNTRLHQPDSFASYDWRASALAFRRLPTHQRLWIPKWLCSVLPIGRNLQRWGIPDQLFCPRCGIDELHRFHVLQCDHVEATATRLEGLRLLSIFLDESHTSPDLKLGLLSLLTATLQQSDWIPPPTDSDATRRAFTDQLNIGTAHVLDGFFSPLWAEAQLLHYVYLGRRSTGVQWMSRVIRMIWQIAWDMWMHRRRIKDTPDDCALPGLHTTLDAAISAAFDTQFLNPDPTLHRWFSRTPLALQRESLDWKERWLEMVKPIQD